MTTAALSRSFHARLSLLPVLFGMGCSVMYVEYDTPSGHRYDITCAKNFALCESKAKDLCPDGFERISSSRRSGHPRDNPGAPAREGYTLAVVCDRPATDAASGRALPSASNAR